jgi:hypothetical protein
MKKRGQLISFDLVLGILIFITAFIFILNQVDNLIVKSHVKLNLQSDFVFNNLELNLKSSKYTDTGKTPFLSNYKIDEKGLSDFQSLNYNDDDSDDFNDMKSLLIKNLNIPDLNLNFCIYFVNKTNKIVDINGYVGIGLSSSDAKIYVGNNIECQETMGSNNLIVAKPYCSEYYTHASNVFKPVVRQGKIMKMNILICGKEVK